MLIDSIFEHKYSILGHCHSSEAGCNRIFAKLCKIAGYHRWLLSEESVQVSLTIRMDVAEPVTFDKMLHGLDKMGRRRDRFTSEKIIDNHAIYTKSTRKV
jgi:hypothetical protein